MLEQRATSGTAARDPLIGRTVGNYRVTELLGSGSFGAVYAAHHPEIGVRVAIKVLHPQFSLDREVVERFINEARAANLIGHENIVKIFDFGKLYDGRPEIVMEFLDGWPLTALVARAPIALAEAGPIVLQICGALGKAHARGIVHRDLKPDNAYLVTRNRRRNFVKIVDFGIAKLQAGGAAITHSGKAIGTPAYMSPEQATGSAIDGRSDIYSLGVIMFQLATGRLPFAAPQAYVVLKAHAEEPPPWPRMLNPDIPPAYEALILRCLAKRPDDRFPTMADLARAVIRVMLAQGLSVARPPEEETAPEVSSAASVSLKLVRPPPVEIVPVAEGPGLVSTPAPAVADPPRPAPPPLMDSGLQTVQRSHRSPTPPLNVRTALREERPQRTIEWRRAARSFAFASAITALVVGGGTIAFDVLGRRAPAQVAAAGPLRPALPPPAAQVPADPPAPPAVVPAAAPISLESAAKPVPAAPVPVRLPIDTEPAGAEVQPKLEPEPRPVPALGNELLEGADSGPAAARKGEGKTFYAKGRYDEAAEAFKWAHAFDPRPSLLFNIAQCFRLGGRNEDAAVYYKRYLKEEPAAKNRAAVQRTLRELRATRPAARAGTEGTGARP